MSLFPKGVCRFGLFRLLFRIISESPVKQSTPRTEILGAYELKQSVKENVRDTVIILVILANKLIII